jgi:hypothetical protein
MRKILNALTITGIVIMTAAFASCAIKVGSGRTVDQTYAYTGFTAVSVGWNFTLDVTRGDAYSVTVTVDDNLTDYLTVSKNGDTLEISLRNGFAYTSTHLKAEVTTPRLTAATLSGASKGNISGFNSADDFKLGVSGASQATLADMSVNKLTLDVSGASRATGDIKASGNTDIQVSGASTVRITGSGVDADIESSGASTADLTDFAVRDARVDVSGASNSTVKASGEISGDVSGASHLYYIGNPTLGSLHTSGASSITRK